MAYRNGDVVLLPFPFSDLSSSKTRPAVVVSIEDYQLETGDILVAMITSVARGGPYDYELRDWQAANLLRPSWVRIKLATLDPALVRHQPGRLSAGDLTEVEQRLRKSLGM